jgi:hypothetical protein
VVATKENQLGFEIDAFLPRKRFFLEPLSVTLISAMHNTQSQIILLSFSVIDIKHMKLVTLSHHLIDLSGVGL